MHWGHASQVYISHPLHKNLRMVPGACTEGKSHDLKLSNHMVKCCMTYLIATLSVVLFSDILFDFDFVPVFTPLLLLIIPEEIFCQTVERLARNKVR